MGGEAVEAGEQILNQAGIPTYDYPDTAAHVFTLMWQSSYNLRGLYETPNLPIDSETATSAATRPRRSSPASAQSGPDRAHRSRIEAVAGRLRDPHGQDHGCRDRGRRRRRREAIGFPVVLKLHSETITHKTDVGGVQLNLRDADAVRAAFRRSRRRLRERTGAEHFQGVSVQPMIKLDGYELIIGSSLDAQFGPVLLFGTGGQLVEVFKDRALGPASAQYHPGPADDGAHEDLYRPDGECAAASRSISPPLSSSWSASVIWSSSRSGSRRSTSTRLLASPERPLALDARVIVHEPDARVCDIPRPAIRPYPTHRPWTDEDGTQIIIRPIRPEDEPLLVKFHGTLSERSVSLRYFHAMKFTPASPTNV